MKSYRVQSPLTAFALLGTPGVAVPTGIADSLPTGVLVTAPRFREDVALDAAEIIEANCPMPTPIDPQFYAIGHAEVNRRRRWLPFTTVPFAFGIAPEDPQAVRAR